LIAALIRLSARAKSQPARPVGPSAM
jgi:hypothetical protein